MIHRTWLASALIATTSFLASADDPVFSGPQVGEKLIPFKVMAVGGEQTGKEVDPVSRADGKPSLFVFVHKLTRPGIGLTKALTGYAIDQEGVATGIIWLDDDKAQAEAYLTRARNSLNFKAPVGVSVDGGEGPGAYGLNRNVELTVLVANDNAVTANFALVQPSLTEAPKIAAELAKLIKKPAPTPEQLARYVNPRNAAMRAEMRRRQGRGGDRTGGTDLRSMMRGLIDATDDATIEKAVKAIETWVGDNKARRAQVKRMSGMVLQRGLGSEDVQNQLKKWQSAKQETPKDKPQADKGDKE